MRDDNGAAGKIEERLLERTDSVNVEVVGRLGKEMKRSEAVVVVVVSRLKKEDEEIKVDTNLIQKQDVGAALDDLGELAAVPLAAREECDLVLSEYYDHGVRRKTEDYILDCICIQTFFC